MANSDDEPRRSAIRAFDDLYHGYWSRVVLYAHILGLCLEHAEQYADKLLGSVLDRTGPIPSNSDAFQERLFSEVREWVDAAETQSGGILWIHSSMQRGLKLNPEDRALLAAIRRLYKPWREAVHLTEFERMTYIRTAVIMQATEAHVREWAACGLAALGEFLRGTVPPPHNLIN